MGYFNRILIANRGEIARRIIRTCSELGIETVAVFSEADKDAPFVKEADHTVLIGPAQAKQSYLDAEKIIGAAKETQADAIHPGYGFLSENAAFSQRCKEEGICFIGPQPEVMTMMGDKIQARKKMEEAGVPIVPGYNGKLESLEEALWIAESLGYPLMLKASAGGGGIGMELVRNEDELKKAFASTMKKADSFFGDGTLFLEKWIENPRHIEVQVVCDQHGNGIHLFERECSIQRRNQKILEESPSPFLDDALRAELCETALKGAQNINYTNVGTMEFIFDDHQNYYFLEMNTRLQVEHPVTEEITGVDLVALQIKIAANEVLVLQQDDIKIKGHAIENRLYAEDPKTFFPSPGTLTTLDLPKDGVRLDFGVEQGNKVTPFYDPMIGKIITFGKDRKAAIEQMKQVLEEMKVEGIKTNLPLLQEILDSKAFTDGNYTTKFVENHFTLQNV
ncbi:acetyl-CoA carboxylase biotin carboxylase subunit [Fictibacillus enclensis]|uniref:acetyl-CoA carboxylase biotin carboxylase subunit n=1 Tax=Fictibacillus enclensis TaxID=1017270 RepID=UPI0025A20C16|nr:acetyl-CoA carboxylase biotin carboxylase subunit [Fictibacillus enclensis]MDM5340610.1 acetyl-CoA carboxylase biotin carboxylase subunit [Fictibacillus enclensis]